MDVVAQKRGFQRGGAAGVRVRQSTAYDTLEINLTTGYSIRGVVIDESGRAVPGIGVLVSTDRLARGGHLKNARMVKESLSCAPELRSPFHAAQVKSDGSGAFTISGLFRGLYVLNVVDREFVMKPHAVVAAGDEGVELVICRAQRLYVRVLDAGSRQPVRRFSSVFTVKYGARGDDNPLSLSGVDGLLDVSFAFARSPSTTTRSIEYSVSASSYVTASGVLSPDQNGCVHCTVLMHRASVFEIPIAVMDAQGAPVTSVKALLASLDGRDVRAVDVVIRGKECIAMVSKGTWELRLSHAQAFPLGTPWRQTVKVDESGWPIDAPPLRVQMDLANSVSFSLGDHAIGLGDISAIDFRSESGQVHLAGPFPSEEPLRWFDVPPAVWEVRVHLRDGRSWKVSFVHGGGHSKFLMRF